MKAMNRLKMTLCQPRVPDTTADDYKHAALIKRISYQFIHVNFRRLSFLLYARPDATVW